jgi:hypothetical protein
MENPTHGELIARGHARGAQRRAESGLLDFRTKTGRRLRKIEASLRKQLAARLDPSLELQIKQAAALQIVALQTAERAISDPSLTNEATRSARAAQAALRLLGLGKPSAEPVPVPLSERLAQLAGNDGEGDDAQS